MHVTIRSKITAITLCFLLSLSCFSIVPLAVNDQDMAQISVKASNVNPTIGETVTVTVSIDNYRTMSPRIAAMFVSLSFDASCFDYVENSESVLLRTNTDDLTSIAFDGNDKINFAYTYANSKKQTLPTTANEIFSFKLKVKSSVTGRTDAVFTVNELSMYNGKNESKYSVIECKAPKIDNVTVWASRPAILLNGTDKNEGVYSSSVVVSFDAASASLVYENRPAVNITSPYTCDKNGTYSITVTVNGEKSTETFSISKGIAHISVKPGTYNTEYPAGVTPDYSAWVLLVTYSDGTYSELYMDDEDVSVTGYNPSVTGQQRLLVKYKDKTTSVNVTVTTKNVVAVSITSPIAKTEYLIGDDIDVTGGMLQVTYDDGSFDEIPITKNMLSGYDNTYVGEQTVNVTYSSSTQSFKVTYYPKDAVDELIIAIDALDLASITLDSRSDIEELIKKYNDMTSLQKSAVTNYEKLVRARETFNDLVAGGSGIDTEITQAPEGETTDGGGKTRSGGNVIWYIVAGIIVLSVLGGVAYFLFIYFKRKKEIDDDEYYDDGDYEDDKETDGDLSYDEDILDIDDDDDDEDSDLSIDDDDDDVIGSIGIDDEEEENDGE